MGKLLPCYNWEKAILDLAMPSDLRYSFPSIISRILTYSLLGETFRYHPNGVFMNSPSAFHEIFNNKANTRKTMWYHGLATGPANDSTITATDKAIHAKKRRILNSVFSEKAIRSAETFIIKHVDRWDELLLGGHGKDWGEPMDMSDMTDYLVFDVLGDLAFGRSFETKEPEDNPLKAIPHAIADALKFANPVRLLQIFLFVLLTQL